MPGKLVQAAANASRSEARKTGVSSIEQFIQSRKVIAKDVATFAPATFVAPSLQLHGIDVKQLPTARVGTKLIGSQRVVPLHKGCNRINVAASDPTNEESFLPLNIATDPTVEEMVVEEDKLAVPPKRFGQTGTKAFDSMIGDETVLENIDLDDDTCLEDGNVDGCGQLEEIGDTPAVKYVRKVLLDKINGGASDIHFEPCEKGYQIAWDGVGDMAYGLSQNRVVVYLLEYPKCVRDEYLDGRKSRRNQPVQYQSDQCKRHGGPTGRLVGTYARIAFTKGIWACIR